MAPAGMKVGATAPAPAAAIVARKRRRVQSVFAVCVMLFLLVVTHYPTPFGLRCAAGSCEGDKCFALSRETPAKQLMAFVCGFYEF